MAENRELIGVNHPQHVNGKTMVLATLAGIAVEGPLVGMMGFTFLTSLLLLVIAFPLLLIFSPLLMGAASVLVFAMAGFGVAGTMAVIGLSSLVVTYRSLKGAIRTGIEPLAVDLLIESDDSVKEHATGDRNIEADEREHSVKIEEDETEEENKHDHATAVVDTMEQQHEKN